MLYSRSGRREAQALPGWAARDVPSSMPRCSAGSLRLIHLLLDCLDCLEMKDRAVCHKHSNGKLNHMLVWWVPVMYCIGWSRGVQELIPEEHSYQLMLFGYLFSPVNPERSTSEIRFKPVECGSWDDRQKKLMIYQCQKWEMDPAEWELMIWNQLSLSAGL